MTRPFMRFAAAWMLMAGALASGSSGVVLCMGADGHLSVEPEQHGHCGPAHDAADQEHDRAPAPDARAAACETCGCVDVALGSDIFSHAAKSLTQERRPQHNASPLSAARYATGAPTDGHRWRRPVTGAAHLLAQSLLEKRTIVLLV